MSIVLPNYRDYNCGGIALLAYVWTTFQIGMNTPQVTTLRVEATRRLKPWVEEKKTKAL